MALPSLSDRQIISVLRKAGFEYAPKRGKGSHSALTKTGADGITRLVIVPQGKDIPRGTLRAILQQANLTPDQFEQLLRQ